MEKVRLIKMNIMVFDLPAVEGGALTILKDFHGQVLNSEAKDINWFFVVSKPDLEESQNIKVLRYPWVKKAWFHRLYFDHFMAGRLIEKYDIDRVLSFQNILIKYTGIPQTVYVHQSLPFLDYRFKFKEQSLFWIYQNIIGRMIKKSIVRAEGVVVQTKWMKKACIEETGVASEKIKVIAPKSNIEIENYFRPNKVNLKTFFFPADNRSYKNHDLIVMACKELKEKGLEDYRVLFTLDADEDRYTEDLYREVKEKSLPIDFIGRLSREKVFELYGKSVLIFPSFIESFGLPMLESRLHGGMILASNCPFSKEVLDGYENAYFFNPFSVNELSKLMEYILLGDIKYKGREKEIIRDEAKARAELLDGLIGNI